MRLAHWVPDWVTSFATLALENTTSSRQLADGGSDSIEDCLAPPYAREVNRPGIPGDLGSWEEQRGIRQRYETRRFRVRGLYFPPLDSMS